MTLSTRLSFLLDKAIQYHRDGNFAEAKQLYLLLVQADRRDPELLYLLGLLEHQQGRSAEALSYIKQSLKLKPNNYTAWALAGLARAACGLLPESLLAYDRALIIKPDHWEVLNNRALVLTDLGRLVEALASCDRAITLKPDTAEAHNNRGNVLRDLGRSAEALDAFASALALQPSFAAAHDNRARVLVDLGRFGEAIAGFTQALALHPTLSATRHSRVLAFAAMNDPIGEVRRLSDISQREIFELLIESGDYLVIHGRHGLALQVFNEAISIYPNDISAQDRKFVLLSYMGELRAASEVVENAIAILPDEPILYYKYGLINNFKSGHPYINSLQTIKSRFDSLTVKQKIFLHFSLSKAFCDTGEHEESLSHLLMGNALKRSQIPFDPDLIVHMLKRVCETLTIDNIPSVKPCHGHVIRPIFFLTMPRSGATLVEQLLSGHSNVFGAGETGLFRSALDRAGFFSTKAYPEAAKQLSVSDLSSITAYYNHSMQALTAGEGVITDKSIDNFWYAGVIYRAIPNARFIHVIRDPVDTCLSCFSKLFDADIPYAYDLSELGRHYSSYVAVMKHWKNQLPPDCIMEVHYESLVSDPEKEMRRILSFCDLGWEPDCLDISKNMRLVKTASFAQVRQKLFRTVRGRLQLPSALMDQLLIALSGL